MLPNNRNRKGSPVSSNGLAADFHKGGPIVFSGDAGTNTVPEVDVVYRTHKFVSSYKTVKSNTNLVGASKARRYLFLQNQGPNIIWLGFEAVAAPNKGIQLDVGQTFVFENNRVPNTKVQATTLDGTTTSRIAILEGMEVEL